MDVRPTAAIAVFALLACTGGATVSAAPEDGRDERLEPTNRATVEAAFPRESYAPGSIARLVIWSRGRNVSLQVFRAGTEAENVKPQDLMLGSPVIPLRGIGNVSRGRIVRIRIGDWPSGLYYAELRGDGGKVGYAPFVLRPRHLGEAPVAVVLSTMTWQAYNFHDDDRNGTLDTWYAGARHARLGRPFENRGTIPHYKHYEEPFLRWLVGSGQPVDYLSDADLDAPGTTGARLAESYRLLVFPGHHEYVTPHEFAAVTAYRNHGGNLMFLSANNFYWRTEKSDAVMTRTVRWRHAGHAEASLVGVQYFANDRGQHQAPWIVEDAPAAAWIFAGTGLAAGDSFARGGVEADATTERSPPGTQVVARIPRVFGKAGADAEMTYYELPNGAKVFAAGAFTLAGSVWSPAVRVMLANLWSRLGDEPAVAVGRRG